MSKSKKTMDDGRWTVDEQEEVTSEPVVSEPVVEEPKKYFELVTWNNVKQVFKCCTCGTHRDDRDSIILHVLNHVPEKERAAVLDTLLKEN